MRKENGHGIQHSTSTIDDGAMHRMLGIDAAVPMTPAEMARHLQVTFFPATNLSPRLRQFMDRLTASMRRCGVKVIPYEEALTGGKSRKVREGIVIIAAGELEAGNLPVDHVSNLRKTTVVGLVDGPCPATSRSDPQEKLNSIVETLAWSIVQVAVFVDEREWTICTMNGAIIPCPDASQFDQDVLLTLVPKLAAPVVPPHASDFDYEEGGLDLGDPALARYVQDFERSGPLWARTGLLLFHTSLESLRFRNMFYRRIAAAYLDRRSGMSYGFLARQLATPVSPALRADEATAALGSDVWMRAGYAQHRGVLHVSFRLDHETYLVPVPEVRVLTTRSGCDKAHLDRRKDLNLIVLAGGRMGVKTPKGLAWGIDSKPSYDTQTILAHALANSLVASVQVRMKETAFSATVRESGIALAHWHGGLDRGVIPDGYSVFGEENPPVSCSTHQAALFALSGKVDAFRRCVRAGREYHGDVHIEPHHGVNVTWPTLTGLAQRLLSGERSATPSTGQTATVAERW